MHELAFVAWRAGCTLCVWGLCEDYCALMPLCQFHLSSFIPDTGAATVSHPPPFYGILQPPES